MIIIIFLIQPSTGESDHRSTGQLLTVLAHQPAEGRQQRRLQRQLRLEAGKHLQL